MCLILVLARCCLPLHQKKTKVSPYRVCVHPPSPQTNLGRHAKVFILGDYVMVSTWQLIRGFPWQFGETRSCLTTDIDVSLADFASDYERNSRGSKKTTRETEGASRAWRSRARALLSRNLKNKRDCLQSTFVCEERAVIHRLKELQAIFSNGNSYLAVAGHMRSPED